MKQLTILVDQFYPVENKIITPGELFHDAGQHSFEGPNWLPQNTQLLLYWNRLKEINIIPISEYNSDIHTNPHYMINGSGSSHILFQSISYIPENSIPIIQKHKIPILIFYPLEYTSESLSEKWLENFCNHRDDKNLKESKIKILTLGPMFDANGDRQSYSDIFPKLKNCGIEFVESMGWLDYWNSHPLYPVYSDISPNMQFELNDQCLNIDEHQTKYKNSIALCLNNRPRHNRRLLLHSLNSNKKYIKNIILSQKFHMQPDDIIQFMINLRIRDNQNSFLLKLFDSKFDVNVKILDAIKDPVNRFELELYFLAKDFKISGMKSLNEDDNSDFNHSWKKEWYNESWCSIITETFLENTHVSINGIESPIISEKTIKPMLNHHPFIVFSHNYSHKLLKSHGFKTFDETWFELPAEGVKGNQTFFERLYNLIESLKRLSNYTDEQLTDKWNQVIPDLIHNKNHLLNTNWARRQKEFILDC